MVSAILFSILLAIIIICCFYKQNSISKFAGKYLYKYCKCCKCFNKIHALENESSEGDGKSSEKEHEPTDSNMIKQFQKRLGQSHMDQSNAEDMSSDSHSEGLTTAAKKNLTH